MKKDYKIGMVVGLVAIVVIGAWFGLKGRSSPRTGYAQGQPPLGSQGPNQIGPGYALGQGQWPPGGQPTGATSPLAGTPGVRPDPNRVTDRTLAGGPWQPGTTPGPSLPQGQPVQAVTPPPTTPTRTHTVLEGESLSDISDRYYGTPNRWDKIVRANQSTIKDPDRIYPGMKLVIPE